MSASTRSTLLRHAIDEVRRTISTESQKLSPADHRRFLEQLSADAIEWRLELDDECGGEDPLEALETLP